MNKDLILDNEWNVLKLGSPVPGLYVPTGSETVKVRGSSQLIGDEYITSYEIVIVDEGKVVGNYRVKAVESATAVDNCFSQ